jgi:hypothetical protein
MTLGNAAAAHVRLIVSCGDCGHRADVQPAALAQKLGDNFPVAGVAARLRCGACGAKAVSLVVSGARR